MEVVTKNNNYFYDNKTGLIFADNSIISSILNISEWHSLSELELINILKIKFDENKIIFYLKWLKKYILFCKKYNYINNMNSSICEIEDYLLKFGFKQLIFSITEDCNFRCSYCIYSDEFLESRSHSLKYMDFDIAKKAINIYFKYFTEWKYYNLFKIPSFSFYGGEPLLNFNLIKKIVSYIKSIYGGEIYFSITTNGSLLTKEISDYLMDNNFSILVSLDGDEKEHNRKRKYKNGRNTFNDVFNNLKYIVDKNYDNIAINSVFDWGTDFINCENFFWSNNLKITNVSAVDDTFTKQYYDEFNVSDFNYHKCYLEYLEQNYQFFNKNEDSYLYHLIEYPLISTLLDSNFISVQRNFNNYTGACVPGEKLFLNPDGDFYICERVPEIKSIGNVSEGINFKEIKKIIDDFNNSLSFCEDCNFSFICNKCYRDFMQNNKFVLAENVCMDVKNDMIRSLRESIEFMESHQNYIEKKHTKYPYFYCWRD